MNETAKPEAPRRKRGVRQQERLEMRTSKEVKTNVDRVGTAKIRRRKRIGKRSDTQGKKGAEQGLQVKQRGRPPVLESPRWLSAEGRPPERPYSQRGKCAGEYTDAASRREKIVFGDQKEQNKIRGALIASECYQEGRKVLSAPWKSGF